jgi:hypothetical protein
MDGVTPRHMVQYLRVNTEAGGTAIWGALADAKRAAADYIRIKQRIGGLHGDVDNQR